MIFAMKDDLHCKAACFLLKVVYFENQRVDSFPEMQELIQLGFFACRSRTNIYFESDFGTLKSKIYNIFFLQIQIEICMKYCRNHYYICYVFSSFHFDSNLWITLVVVVAYGSINYCQDLNLFTRLILFKLIL